MAALAGCVAEAPVGTTSGAIIEGGYGLQCLPTTYEILAAEGYDPPVAGGAVGSLSLSNDANNIYLGIDSGGLGIVHVDAYAGTNPAPLLWHDDLQTTGFDYGAFPIQEDFDPATQDANFAIAWEQTGLACGDEVKIVVHVVFEDGTEGWAVSNPDLWLFDGFFFYFESCSCEPPPPDDGCTFTQGYWRNHPEAWPVDSLVLGDHEYSKDELLALFATAPKGDASLILAHQLIAALLNVANGASPIDAIDDAQDWLSANGDVLPFGKNKATHNSGTAIADELADYNEGEIGPGHCDG
jgi:hypothetical protein